MNELRILLVDDHPIVRDGLRMVLRASMPGCLVAEAGSGREALARIGDWQPRLVLVDVQLPGMNGLELAREIRRREKGILVLMVAAVADPWTVQESVKAGAIGFLAKTLVAKQLVDAIRAALAGERFFCDDSAVALRRAEDLGQPAVEPPGPAILSVREREVLQFLVRGCTTRAIALELRISPKTVETHRIHIFRKLGLDNSAALTRYAIRHELLAV